MIMIIQLVQIETKFKIRKFLVIHVFILFPVVCVYSDTS